MLYYCEYYANKKRCDLVHVLQFVKSEIIFNSLKWTIFILYQYFKKKTEKEINDFNTTPNNIQIV